MPRVLVVLPFYGGSLPIGRYCASALEESGCLVEVFEAPGFFPADEAIRRLKVSPGQLGLLRQNYLRFVSQCITSKAETFDPDLVLSMAQAPLTMDALKRLRAKGVATAMWFVEDYRLFPYWQTMATQYDAFAVIQKEPFLSMLRDQGVQNALYLPLAAQPAFHKPLDLSPEEKAEFGAPLSFMGEGYPNRRNAFARLATPGLKIWGTGWEEEPALAPLIQRQGTRVSPEDAVRIFNATSISLNLHSSVQTIPVVSGGDFVNPRTFEIAACGAFQLVDERALLPELFAGDEMALFKNMEELRDKIAYYQVHADERAAMAERARKRVLAEHTYTARMRTLLEFLMERLPGLAKRVRERGPKWPENTPEEVRASASALIAALGLPEDAAFSDIIAAIRRKSGRLSDTEAALLFLEEWRVLYQDRGA